MNSPLETGKVGGAASSGAVEGRSDSSSFAVTPPAPRALSRGAFVITIRRGGVTMALRCPPASLALDLAERLMSGASQIASVQASAQGAPAIESEQQATPGNLFEDAPRQDDGLVYGFLADRTESAQRFFEPVATLTAAYFKFCSDCGQEPLSPYAFGQELRNLKFRQGRTRRIKCGSPVCPKCRSEKGGHQTRTWEGVRLRQSAAGPALVVPVPSEAAS